MVVTSSQMLAAEQAVINGGVSAAQLMDEAAEGIHAVLRQFFPRPGRAILYLGRGNNAGDALVVARHLLSDGWKVSARCVAAVNEFKELPARHWNELAGRIELVRDGAAAAGDPGAVILIDGIMGTGAAPKPLAGTYADAVLEMNAVRRSRHATTVAIDLPTGLGGGGPVVEADLTVTIGFPKTALLEDEATAAVGRLAVVPLKELTRADGDTTKRLLTAPILLPSLPRRSFEFHKGMAGRVAVIAGSRGFLGAAILAASGALRGGAGLVTLWVMEDVYSIVAPMAPPEVMVRPMRRYREALEGAPDAVAIGPGLGGGHDDEILELISGAAVPAVVDADALNALSRRGLDALRQGKAPRLLTPHPGEMARLAEHFSGWKPLGRAEIARAFCREFPHATLLLKGARTVIASEGEPTSFNSTGTPGMASGGMGDVLTGLCAGLAAQGVDLHEAACLGAWLSGRAAEIAIATGTSSEESLGASDVLSHLGGAFQDLKRCAY